MTVGPIIQVFCEGIKCPHERSSVDYDEYRMLFKCSVCNSFVTREFVLRALPPLYRSMVENWFGAVLTALADVAAIDVIVKQYMRVVVEERRERDLET